MIYKDPDRFLFWCDDCETGSTDWKCWLCGGLTIGKYVSIGSRTVYAPPEEEDDA